MAKVFPIGLDIGTGMVRLLQLGGAERDLRVLQAGRFAIPQEVRADPQVRRQVLVEGVATLMRERRFRSREVVIGLSDRQLAVRNIRMPKMPEDELPTAVTWEAQNKFPFDTATAVIQSLRAGEVRQGDKVLDELILFAVPRTEIDEQIRLAADLGLDLVSLDPQVCSIFRTYERFLRRREDEDVICVFVDIGSRTSVVIARGRQIVFVKTIPLGGDVFNRSVAECLDLSVVEAEALRRRISRRARGDTAHPEEPDRVRRAVADAIRCQVEELAGEIGLCLRYYGVTFRGARPRSITFTGGEAHDPDLPNLLGDRLGVRVEVGDPFCGVGIEHLGSILDRRGRLSEWSTAFGLSLKGARLAEQVLAA